MAISALALAINQAFVPYMQPLIAPLKAALENTDDYHVCSAAVGVVGDLSRAVHKQMSPFCEEIFLRLMQLLMNQLLHRSVKPPILSCFGDIALAVGPAFEKYVGYVVPMLQSAQQLSLQTPHLDDNNEFVEGQWAPDGSSLALADISGRLVVFGVSLSAASAAAQRSEDATPGAAEALPSPRRSLQKQKKKKSSLPGFLRRII